MKRKTLQRAGAAFLKDGKVHHERRLTDLRLVPRHTDPEGPDATEPFTQQKNSATSIHRTPKHKLGARKLSRPDQMPETSVDEDAVLLRQADIEDIKAAATGMRAEEVFGIEVPSLAEYKEEVVSLREINERAAAVASSKTNMRLLRFRRRFQWFGDVWVAVLYYIRWKSSLRFTLEVPYLFSVGRLGAGAEYMIRKSEYLAGLMAAMDVSTSPVPLPYLGKILEESFDVLNPTGRLKIDRREALCFWQFYRMKPDSGPGEVIRMLFRSFDGDRPGGLNHINFMKMLVQLCISRYESQDVLAAVSSAPFEAMANHASPASGGVPGFGIESQSIDSSHASLVGASRPSVHRKITTEDLERIIRGSPYLLQVFEGIRLKRLPAALRSMVQRARLNKQLDRTQRYMNEVNYKMKLRHAARLWQQQTTRRCFVEWKVAVATLQQHRLVEYRHKSRRALRTWLKWARFRGISRKQNRMARVFHVVRLSRRVLRGLQRHVDAVIRFRNLLTNRADASFAQLMFERYFGAWKEAHYTGIAERKFSSMIRRRCLRALHSHVQQQTLAGQSRRQLRERSQAGLQAEADRRARIRIKAARDAEARQAAMEQEAFAAEVEAITQIQAAESEAAKARADRKRAAAIERYNRMREAQARRRRVEALASFKARWDGAADRAGHQAAERAKVWLESDDGESWLEEERKRFYGYTRVEYLSQSGSEFQIECRQPSGRVWAVNRRTGQEFRCAPLSRENAIAVLKAHRIAKETTAARQQVVDEERAEWETMHRERVARALQAAFLSHRMRNVVLDMYRSVLEQTTDPFSGKVSYVDLRTGEVLPRKPLMFRRAQVHPDPDWILRKDLVRGRYYYMDPSKPDKQKYHAPKGYLLCFECRLDFASRRCYGEGCSGYAYCFSCWESAHPPEDPVLAAHASSIESVPRYPSVCQMHSYCERVGAPSTATCVDGTAADGILWDDYSWYQTLCRPCALAWSYGKVRRLPFQPATCSVDIPVSALAAPEHVTGGDGPAEEGKDSKRVGKAKQGHESAPQAAVGQSYAPSDAEIAAGYAWDFYEFLSSAQVEAQVRRMGY